MEHTRTHTGAVPQQQPVLKLTNGHRQDGTTRCLPKRARPHDQRTNQQHNADKQRPIPHTPRETRLPTHRGGAVVEFYGALGYVNG